ncbi:MAG: M56 family metallopeptidase [Phycisphaerae bacterium]
MEWAESAGYLLWQNAWTVLLPALAVAMLTRFLPCRPATRHSLWVVVLVWFVAPLMLPRVPEVTVDRHLRSVQVPEPNRPSAALEAPTTTLPRPIARRDDATTTSDQPIRMHVAPRAAAPRLSTIHRTTPVLSDPAALGPAGDSSPLGLVAAARPIEAASDTAEACEATVPPVGTVTSSVEISSSESSVTSSPSVVLLQPTWRWSTMLTGIQRQAAEALSTTATVWAAWVAGLESVREAVLRLPTIPGSVWLTGSALLATVMFLRIWWFRRVTSRALPAPRWVVREAARVARGIGLRRAPTVLMVETRVSPLVSSGVTPTLVLPVGLWTALDRAGRRAILCHELAHLLRRDHWVRWIELLVTALYWWHPLTWWVRRRIRDEADLCCDAWVTWLMPQGRRAYAEALLHTNEYCSGNSVPTVGMAVATPGARNLSRRLTMVMTQTIRPRVSLGGTALVLAVMLGGWMTTPALSCPPKDDEAAGLTKAGHAQGHSEGHGASHAIGISGTSPAVLTITTSAGGDDDDDDAKAASKDRPRAQRRSPEARAESDDARGGEEIVRTYAIPEGKRDLLVKLMIRDDVPIRVAATPDGIEVHATARQHATFKAFVDVIRPEFGYDSFRIGGEKGEALQGLLSLDDVQVIVSGEDDGMQIRGTKEERDAIGAFIRMIDPDGDHGPRRTPRPDRRERTQAAPTPFAVPTPGTPAPALAPTAPRAPKPPRAAKAPRGGGIAGVPFAPDMPELHKLELPKVAIPRLAVIPKDAEESLAAVDEHLAKMLKDTNGDLNAEFHESIAKALEQAGVNNEQIRSKVQRALEAARIQAQQSVRNAGNQARQARRQAENLQRQAERLQQQAERLREQADRLREQADQESNQERSDSMRRRSSDLETRMTDLEQHVRTLEVQSDELEAHADQIESEAENQADLVLAQLDSHENELAEQLDAADADVQFGDCDDDEDNADDSDQAADSDEDNTSIWTPAPETASSWSPATFGVANERAMESDWRAAYEAAKQSAGSIWERNGIEY